MGNDLSRYRPMIRGLAERALGLAVDASPHRAAPTEVRFSLTQMLPTARALLGGPTSELVTPPTGLDATFVDGRGQGRFSYRTLCVVLHHRATGALLPLPDDGRDDAASRLWRSWHAAADGADVEDRVSEILRLGDDCLVPQQLDEPPDHWTYRELVGLHALRTLIGQHPAPPERWTERLRQITAYHQQHTQPDYTTYQPWALAAFLSNPETTWFAEQQLHDVQSHLSIEGGAGAVLPALLLADAYAVLPG
jgi:hypothetical protein